MNSTGVTLSRYIFQEEQKYPEISGELSALLAQIGFAAKLLSREIGRAALVGRLGLTGEHNVTGDPQKKLDVFANEIIVDAFAKSDLVAVIISEELEEIRQDRSLAAIKRSIFCVSILSTARRTLIPTAASEPSSAFTGAKMERKRISSGTSYARVPSRSWPVM